MDFTYSGRLLIYSGLGDGQFSSSPSSTVYPDPGEDNSYATFGWAMETVKSDGGGSDSVLVSERHYLGGGRDQAGKQEG